MNMNLSKLQEIEKDREDWCAVSIGSQRVGHDLATEQHHRINVKIRYFSQVKVLTQIVINAFIEV